MSANALEPDSENPIYAERSRHFARCRPKTTTECTIAAQVVRPLFQAEIRHYFWQRDLDPTPFEIDICYLELALNPRPDAGVNYLNSSRDDAFVASGNCCFIPPNQRTIMRTSQGKQLVIGCMFEQAVFAPYVDWQWTPLELAACINLHNRHIHNALLQLSQELMNPGYKSGEWLDSLFGYLLVELSRHIRAVRHSQKDATGKLAPHQLQLIDMHIGNADQQFPQTAWLAEQLGISPRHLARLFKQTTGQTITDYVTETRIERAKTLLLNSKQAIKTIAYQCGFQNPSAFTQAFRRATGLTPKQYRKPQKQIG